MSTGEASSSVGAAIQYDYGNSDDKKSDSNKAPRYNGDPDTFSWWETKTYSFNMGLDDELWDVLEDGVGNLALDE
jgi:hypothetical protein